LSLLSSRPYASRAIAVFFGASALLHVLALAAIVVFGALNKKPYDLDKAVVKTRLVKLGKQRDEKLLPRLEQTKPPPPPPEKGPPIPAPEQKTTPKPTPTEKSAPKPSAAEILKQFNAEENRPNLTELINERIGEPSDEGHEEGSKLGVEITGRLKAEYSDKVLARVKNNLSNPQTLSEQERMFLSAVLALAIGPDGELLSARIQTPSGNDAFDNAVLSAAKKSAPFPPPPIPVRDFYADGVGINVCPVRCK